MVRVRMVEKEKLGNGLLKKIKNGGGESKDALFWFCLALGVVMMLMAVIKFFLPSANIPQQLIFAYPILLATYVAVKEVVRWTSEAHSSHLGEIFVYLWWGTFFILNTAEFLFGLLGLGGGKFRVPGEMLAISIEILVVFACSEISKKIYKSKNGNNKKITAV